MALKETYLSNLKQAAGGMPIYVMRNRGHNNLSPSEDLLKDFKKREAKLKKAAFSPIEAHNQAWMISDN